MGFLTTLIYSNRTGIRILRHVLFWAVDIANYLLVISVNVPITQQEVYKILFRIPFIALAAYFIMYYLIPKFSKPEDRTKLFLYITASLVALALGMRYYRFHILEPLIDPNTVVDYNIWDVRRVIAELFSVMVVICMAVVIKLLKSKTELQQKNDELIMEKKTAELGFLKAQMHPHFLFNTLNTLYSETIQESGKAQSVVLHLSSLLRFMLDECNKPLIPLSQEIKVMKDFIALEELRHGARLKVNVIIEDVDLHMKLSPLIFLPFVENSFKHTLSNKRGQIHIDIAIREEDGHLSLRISNDKEEVNGYRNGHQHGQGISNIRRQLELLYGKNYSLKVEALPDTYTVSLLIPVKPSLQYA